jgi:hypothetical protein
MAARSAEAEVTMPGQRRLPLILIGGAVVVAVIVIVIAAGGRGKRAGGTSAAKQVSSTTPTGAAKGSAKPAAAKQAAAKGEPDEMQIEPESAREPAAAHDREPAPAADPDPSPPPSSSRSSPSSSSSSSSSTAKADPPDRDPPDRDPPDRDEPKPSHHTSDPPDDPKRLAEAELAYRNGVQLAAVGDTDGAVKSLRSAAAGNPGHAPTWRALGEVYEKRGETGQARSAYQKYLRLAPNAGDAGKIRDRLRQL